MQSYVVRVYRNNKENPYGLVGLIEEVGVEGKRAFTNLDELWNILKTPPEAGPKRKRGNGVNAKRKK